MAVLRIADLTAILQAGDEFLCFGAVLGVQRVPEIHEQDPTGGGGTAEDHALAGATVREVLDAYWSSLVDPSRRCVMECCPIATGMVPPASIHSLLLWL